MGKKIGMMQPYLFPYLGYFQLIAAVDVFVLGDDLQYVKESWINRNRILMNGKDKLITFPLKKGAHLSKINERALSDDYQSEMQRLLRVLYAAYAKAPYYKKVNPLLEEIFMHRETNLAKYAENSIRKLCAYMSIATPILIASDLEINDVSDKQDRVIRTAKKLDGQTYINFVGGMQLYDFDRFEAHGMELKFHKIGDVSYPQFRNEFVPLLSIIDVLMFNDIHEVRKKLNCYSLLGRPADQKPYCRQPEGRGTATNWTVATTA
ncbi:WbqC family protein [Noviherbaspirillum agri]